MIFDPYYDPNFNPRDPVFLRGNVELCPQSQRAKRETYIELVLSGALEAPRPEWFVEYQNGVSGDAKSRIATSIYNTLVDSGSPFEGHGYSPIGGFADALQSGDAELWTLIRLGLEESEEADFRLAARQRP